MEASRRLIDHYLPPAAGFVLESLVATTYEIDFEFLEEELLAAALGVRSSAGRLKPFRSELERKLQKVEVSVLYNLKACGRLSRLSPRIDAIPISARKLHAKISVLMWIRDNPAGDGPPERRMRLLVGSANLTRQGFRLNYECVVSLDYGGGSAPPSRFLAQAIEWIAEMKGALEIPQLSRQLAAFAGQTARLPESSPSPDSPVALVGAGDAEASIREAWARVSSKPPETLTVVSPFWAGGSTAHEALSQLFRGLGIPSNLELVCRGVKASDGNTWLPVFDSHLAHQLKSLLRSRIFLRAALPDASVESISDAGDEQEAEELAKRLEPHDRTRLETERPLHAKIILLDGPAGSVLYVGSSNCTRRGLGLGGPVNWEAGFVFRLSPRQRKRIGGLLAFAGPATEVQADTLPSTVQPAPEEETFAPAFLAEVVACRTAITLRFSGSVPPGTLILMPIPTKARDAASWFLYRQDGENTSSPRTVTLDLESCPLWNERLGPQATAPSAPAPAPNVFVDVRWQGHSAFFPVRFDDKAHLPLFLLGRKPSEREIIDSFLFGSEPDESDALLETSGDATTMPDADAPVDTRRILAYFIRRFVQAIPGIEAEIRRASYSRAALDSALRGPISPLELAERAFSGLQNPIATDEPRKTPAAVGFQLVEIIAALRRCRSASGDPALQACFDPAISRCRDLLEILIGRHAELRNTGFRLYRMRILGEIQ